MAGYLYETEVVKADMEEIVSDGQINYKRLRNATVLVTGANGMLAYYCTCAIMYLNETRGANVKVIALVRNKEKGAARFGMFALNPLFELLVADVCEPIDINEKVDYIIHAAGSASPRYIKEAPLSIINANVIGTMNVCELARKCNCENVLFTSTREIYGAVSGTEFIKETDMGITDPLEARSCYPESKRMAEQILKSYGMQYGVNYTVTRIAHSYGPGMETENDGRVMSDFMSDVINNRDIVLKSDGSAVRAFCYITDAVRGMFYVLLNGDAGEAYNIANENEPMMIRDVAKLMTGMFPEKNISTKLEVRANDGGYCSYKRVGLDTGKLEKLGWSCKISLEEGVRRTVIGMMDC